MNTHKILAPLATLLVLIFASISRADDFNAVQSGNWSDPNTWVDNTTVTNGIVPGANDSADIPAGINVTVDTNESIGFIYDNGTVTMGTNASLNVYNDQSISPTTTLDTSAAGNAVIYLCNPFDAKQCNYYNLVLNNTNVFVPPTNPFAVHFQDFNNFSTYGPTPMTIAGDFTLIGAIKVQQGSGGAPITIGGNLVIGQGCIWDCSGDILTVVSNVYVYGLLEDLNSALGTDTLGGNVIVSGPSTPGAYFFGGPSTNGWSLGDVTNWNIGGNFTNNGATFGAGFGSITFNGTGAIAGSNALTIPTMTVSGTYLIADTITLTTNTPTLNGTLVFDLARTNQIVLRYSSSGTNAQTTQTNFYSGNLIVINSGIPPVSGNIYKLFSASNYAGAFASETFPSLASGLSWVDETLTNGSIVVIGSAGSPILTLSKNGVLLTLSWDSTTFPGYSVQAQTNSAGPLSNWSPTGSGTVSPYMVTTNPANRPVFFRLFHP